MVFFEKSSKLVKNLKYFNISLSSNCFYISPICKRSIFIFHPLVLPCPKLPPGKPEGGWFEYDLQNSKYKCPNGHEFLNDQIGQRYYPYWYSNCTIAKAWDPPAVDDCVRKIFLYLYGT